jgi:hypothetical protein
MKYGPGLEGTQGVGANPKTYVMVSNGGKEDAGWTTVHRRGTKRSPVPLPK